MSWILRTFDCRDQKSMTTLYKATVLPLLEYCSQLWCPNRTGDIRKIENIQRNFTSKIEGMYELTYWERLNRLNMKSLERRRERYSKIISGIVPNFSDDRFMIRTRVSERRGLTCIVPPIHRGATTRIKTLVEQSFAVRGPRLYNCLPKHLRDNNPSYENFKIGIDDFFEKIPDLPYFPGYPQTAQSNSLVDQIEQCEREGIYF